MCFPLDWSHLLSFTLIPCLSLGVCFPLCSRASGIVQHEYAGTTPIKCMYNEDKKDTKTDQQKYERRNRKREDGQERERGRKSERKREKARE